MGIYTFDNGVKKALENTANARKGRLPGLATHFTELDKMTGGLRDGDLIILAGRQAMGKTALATCMAFNAAKDFYDDNLKEDCRQRINTGMQMAFYKGNQKDENKFAKKSVMFFSLETSVAQLVSRILSAQAQIDGTRMRDGKIDQSDFNRIADAAEWMRKFPLYIDDTPGLTVNQIRTRAKRLKRGKTGLGLIVIDYLQLIEGDSKNGNPENRVQEVSETTRKLKLIAKELKVPVVVLSQLNRGVESRDEKIPQLADLREFGSIVHDADIVMAVYREYYYLSKKKIVRRSWESEEEFNIRLADWECRKSEIGNIAEVLVLKNRYGETGNVKLFFDGSHSYFTNLNR